MTLQKQTLVALPILLSVSFSSGPTITKPTTLPLYNQQAITADSSLPYFPKLIVRLSSKKTNSSPQESLTPRMSLNANAASFVHAYIRKNRKDLEEIDKRSKALFPKMESELEKQGLPNELKYLAVVESDLKLKARSSAGAVGYWQLMKQTAVELGLKVNGKTDERKQLRKSTAAAAAFLKNLYSIYDDWLLTIAAYNAGPGIINKAIKKTGSRNFWRIQNHLPTETRGHVKRYIAVHHFFEGTGGETTITKAERLAYEKEVKIFVKQAATNTIAVDSTQR